MKNMLATIKDIIEDLEDRLEISIFIICAGLVISAAFGMSIT